MWRVADIIFELGGLGSDGNRGLYQYNAQTMCVIFITKVLKIAIINVDHLRVDIASGVRSRRRLDHHGFARPRFAESGPGPF